MTDEDVGEGGEVAVLLANQSPESEEVRQALVAAGIVHDVDSWIGCDHWIIRPALWFHDSRGYHLVQGADAIVSEFLNETHVVDGDNRNVKSPM